MHNLLRVNSQVCTTQQPYYSWILGLQGPLLETLPSNYGTGSVDMLGMAVHTVPDKNTVRYMSHHRHSQVKESPSAMSSAMLSHNP